jgi:hypothetical protein
MDFLKKKMKELLDDDDKKPAGKQLFISIRSRHWLWKTPTEAALPILMALQAVPVMVIVVFKMDTTDKADTAARPNSSNTHPKVKATRRRVRLKVKDTLPRARVTRLKVTVNSSPTARARLHP